MILTPRCDASPDPGVQAGLVGLAPAGYAVWINGQPARTLTGDLPALGVSWRRDGQYWRLTHPLGQLQVDPARYTPFYFLLPLQGPVAEVEIEARQGTEVLVASADLYFNPEPTPVYSVTVDDTADLLAELVRQPSRYPSLFDHPILAFARDLHRRYGAVFTFFLFYQGTTYAQFDLSQMSDRYRDEWAQNADWLRLGFHARAMLPTSPYVHATTEQALGDFAAVRDQVLRFAGPGSWDPLLRSHYWSGSREAVRAWHQAGIRGFYGAAPGYPGYYLTAEQNSLVHQGDYWWDQAEDVFFIQTDIWLERDFADPGGAHTTVDSLVPVRLDSLFRQPYASQNVQVFTHESLLLDHAVAWQVRQRLEETAAWLAAHGYESHFDSKMPFFNTLLPPPTDLHLESTSADSLTLSWNHHPRQSPCRYQVYHKDLANPAAPWVKVGEGAGTRFTDAWRAGVYLYRVYAVDGEERRSAGSSPLRVSFHPVPDFNGDKKVNGEHGGLLRPGRSFRPAAGRIGVQPYLRPQ
ncbi:MAG: fibronectin type III domain-containing protein [Candidatus Latescibacteria bacterium]|nr:fibronectin type III domain-containing protein [Candidatus Latescibacterota bacterium]